MIKYQFKKTEPEIRESLKQDFVKIQSRILSATEDRTKIKQILQENWIPIDLEGKRYLLRYISIPKKKEWFILQSTYSTVQTQVLGQVSRNGKLEIELEDLQKVLDELIVLEMMTL